MHRRSPRVRQKTLAFREWGGARRGAGRKPAGERAGVSHRARPALSSRHPVHVTVKIGEAVETSGLTSDNRDELIAVVRERIAKLLALGPGAPAAPHA